MKKKTINIGFPLEYEDNDQFCHYGLFLRENEVKAVDEKLQELQRKDNIINELKEKINQFTLIIGYYDYNDEGNDEIGENNNLQEELLNIINLDKIKELENEKE